jgi:hypothetical protein
VSTDFSALAGAVAAGAPGVRACLFVNEDGLPLGAHPAAEEVRALGAWSRLSTVGTVGRGFMTVDEEMWAVSGNGHYAALALADRTTRPGLLLERLDAAIAWAEERRTEDLDSLEAPIPGGSSKDRATAAGRRFRMPLHRESKAEPEPVAAPAEQPIVAESVRAQAPTAPEIELVPVAEAAPPAAETLEAEPSEESEGERTRRRRGEVDVVALAREFAALLSEEEGP